MERHSQRCRFRPTLFRSILALHIFDAISYRIFGKPRILNPSVVAKELTAQHKTQAIYSSLGRYIRQYTTLKAMHWNGMPGLMEGPNHFFACAPVKRSMKELKAEYELSTPSANTLLQCHAYPASCFYCFTARHSASHPNNSDGPPQDFRIAAPRGTWSLPSCKMEG